MTGIGEVNTTDPNYYKWTQWIFTKLYEKGLAYEAEVPVNWVEELGTAIANEEVLPDGTSERGGYPVVRKPMRQWMLKSRLMQSACSMTWMTLTGQSLSRTCNATGLGNQLVPMSTFQSKREQTRNSQSLRTRPDTLFGATFTVLAPEHDLVDAINNT